MSHFHSLPISSQTTRIPEPRPLPLRTTAPTQVVNTSKQFGFGGYAEIEVLPQLQKRFPGIPGLGQ